MIDTKSLARHYGNLTPEERFRLILAAGSRGDKAEQDRLVKSGGRIALSIQDHAPYAYAFDELAFLIFIELLEEAARYLEAFTHADDTLDVLGDDEEEEEGEDVKQEDGGEVAEEEGGGEDEERKCDNADEEVSDATANAKSAEEARSARSLWQRFFDMALAAGFVLRTKAEGWELFCERMTIPPFALWEHLPGFDRLQRALRLAERAAFAPEGFLRWLNDIRPAGEAKWTKVPLTVEGMAAATGQLFRERVDWWGG
jgi:hypothetical protein